MDFADFSLMTNFDENIAAEKPGERQGSWMFLKALVTETRMKDTATAKKLYEEFLAKYPNHPLAAMAKTRSDKLAEQTPEKLQNFYHPSGIFLSLPKKRLSGFCNCSAEWSCVHK